MSATKMAEAWNERLDVAVGRGDAVFVLDIHQWIASQPENLEAVRQFIRHAKSKMHCRITTLDEAARYAMRETARIDGLPWAIRGEK